MRLHDATSQDAVMFAAVITWQILYVWLFSKVSPSLCACIVAFVATTSDEQN
jgi:hypothetical protein